MRSARARAIAAALLAFAFATSIHAAVRYDPRLQFRTLRTAHFDIHAHQGEDALARRLGVIAESVRTRLGAELGYPSGRVQVILVDQSDLSNGWSTPVPYDTIEIAARPPATGSLLGNTTDWLELVFTHEYTHILHLDKSRGFMAGIHRVFGRVPVAFPNLFLPEWQVEGIATYEESRQTGEGRIHEGDFRLLVDTAARAGRFEPFDRASGGLDDWPGGNAAYAYGGLFHQFLSDRYGPERIAALRDATAGRVPYFGAAAFRRVYGKPLDELWTEFAQARAAAASPASATDARSTRLTHDGFTVDAVAVSGPDVLYRTDGPDAYPSLMRLSGGARTRIAWRYEGNRTTVHDSWAVFDQVTPVRAVAWYSDLYAVPVSGGRVRRLTHEARAGDPAFSPDGRRLACTIERSGHVALGVIPFDPRTTTTPEIVVDEADADFGAPAWSPDGRTIVAERRRGSAYELVSIDVATHAIRTRLTSAVRVATPAYAPDGRTIFFAADPAGEPLNVFALDVASGTVRRVTDSATGARAPQPTADGRSLVYIGYTTAGYDVFETPIDPAAWPVTSPTLFAGSAAPRTAPIVPAPPPAANADLHPYSPWPTLKPTYWSPVLTTDAGEVLVGAGTAMADALGRHAYAASAAWSTRALPDWQVSYAYDRWRPTLFATYADDTDPVDGGEVRSETLTAGALLPFEWLRRTETLFAGVNGERDRLACDGPCRVRVTTADRVSAQGGWLHDTRRAFGYSISTEEGHAVAASVESSVAGSASSARAAVFDGRLFERLGRGHAVLAVRGASALAWGPLPERRVFSAAGPGPGPARLGFDFGRDTIGLLRGFAAGDVIGTRAAVANVDVRLPLARPQRGTGVYPLFVRAIHGAAFVDAGAAWDASLSTNALRTSVGGEGAADLVLGHYLPVTVALGAAWTRDPVAHERGLAFFGRIGHAF